MNNLSVEFDQEKVRVQQELQNAAIILEEMKQTVKLRLENFQGNPVKPLPAHFYITDVIIAQKNNNMIVSCFFFACGII